jgi:hypothetical protein
MADAPFDPLGQLPPLANADAPVVPWSWVPPEWDNPATPPADDPSEIQMPAVDARPPEVKLGMPHDPGPILDQEAAPPPPEVVQVDQPGPFATQPGLGIPVHALDNAVFAPPPPDAISGGDLTPIAPGGNEYQFPDPHSQQLTEDQQARQFAASSPEDQAKALLARQQAEETERNKRIAETNLQDEQKALENHHALKVAQEHARAVTAKLEADAAEEAKRPIGPRDRSTLQGIFGVIAAALGGIVASKTGGPNQALEYMNHVIDREIQTSQANKNARLQDLARRGASNEQLLAQASADHEEAERWRLQMLTRAQNQVATDMQQFDPRGKAAQQLGQMYSAIGAQRVKSLQDFQDKNFKDHVEAMKFAAEQRKAEDEHNKSVLEQRKLAGALGAGGAKETDPQDVLHQPNDFAALGFQAPPAPMSFNGYKKWLETRKLSSEATTGDATLSKEELEHGVGDLQTVDGKPFLAQGSTEAVGKLRDQVAAARNMVRLMDETRAIRTGWTSDTAKSKEWQEIKANWAALKGEAKNLLQLGALSESDYDLVDSFIGSPDPTKWQGRVEGIAKARENIINKTRTALNANAARGKVKFDIPYIAPTPPKATAADTAQKNALHAPSGQDVFDAGMPTPIKGPLEIAHEIENGKPAEVPAQADSLREAGLMGDVPKVDREHIDGLAEQLVSTDKAEREKAAALLQELAGAGKTPTANYARDVLHRHVLNNAQAAVDESLAPQTAVVHEEAPPRPAKEPNKPKKGGR